MKSKILALALALAAVPATSAFSLNEVKPDFDAYVSLLNDKGYVIRSYDISQLADTTYMLGLIVREYDGGKMIHDGSERFNYMIRNRLMASGFSESARASLDPAEMADPEKGIVTLGSRINIGLSPLNDSTLRISMEIPETGASYQQLALRPQTHPATGQIQHNYLHRPFKVQEFQSDTFIPLLFVGSAWYDPEIGVFRFCGENEISPDLSEEIVSHVPHFYVVGIQAYKQKDK